jgi:hypothetical protein
MRSSIRQKPIFKLILTLGSTLLLLACVVPALSAPTPQPSAPGAVETIIFETAVAARTQTAELLPPTQAVTSTPTPTKTPTNTPSPTPTILILLPTYTQVVLPTLTLLPGEGGGEAGDKTQTPSPNEHNYKGTKKCAVVGQNPPDGTVFRPRQKFTGRWTIENTGTAAWKKGWFDYQYLGGDKFHDRARYDMNYILDPGDTIDIKVVMHAPKQPGSYETTWIFGSKKNALCKMTLAIVVE